MQHNFKKDDLLLYTSFLVSNVIILLIRQITFQSMASQCCYNNSRWCIGQLTPYKRKLVRMVTLEWFFGCSAPNSYIRRVYCV